MIAIATAFGLAIGLALGLLRLFLGRTLYDRALAAYGAVLSAALMCAAFAVSARQTAWLDVSIALVLGGFIVSAAVLKFFRARSFQAPMARPSAEETL